MAWLQLLLLSAFPLFAGGVRPSSVLKASQENLQRELLAEDSNASSAVVRVAKEWDPAWSISLGPFTICDTGLSVAPKFEIGVEVAGCGARVGVGDVRDGISLFASASASFQVFGKGSNWKNMLQNLRTNAHHLPDISSSMKSLIDDAIHTTDKVVGPSGQETAEVVRLLNEEAPESAGITKADLLKDHSSSSAMEVMMKASSGIGISAKVCPGWKDADGFHNLGGGASLDMGVELSFDLVVGYRPRPPGGGPRMVRLLLGLCNFFFQITFPIG